MRLETLPYPKSKDEIIVFVKRHHYSRRCPGVWTVAHVGYNQRGILQAVSLSGPAPYPSIAKRFVRCPEHAVHVSWQARMVGAGISTNELDELLTHASMDLLARNFWWAYTLVDTTAWIVDGALLRLLSPGYTGQAYTRNGFAFLGYTKGGAIDAFIIDGKPVHPRQGRLTLTLGNVHEHYPNSQVRVLRSKGKARFAQTLARSERERAERSLLMAFHALPWQPLRQPRLFFDLKGWQVGNPSV